MFNVLRRLLVRASSKGTGLASRNSQGERSLNEIERAIRKGACIGANVRVYGVLDKVNPHLLTIGDHCVIGTHSAVLAHCPIRGPRQVCIGNYVWVGFNACVLPGVSIGDVAIVGAGAVVASDVPANSIVVGNPARVLRSLTPEESNRLTYCLEHRLPIGGEGYLAMQVNSR